VEHRLPEPALDISSKAGDVVFDPFGGSGTTYVAAELKGRQWFGVEISTCAEIAHRFSQIKHDKENLAAIRKKLNILFTEEVLQLRRKNGHLNGKYRLDGPEDLQGSIEEERQLRLMLERGHQYLCECAEPQPGSHPVQSQQ